MLQSTYRLILAGVVAFTVAAGVAITIVVLATRKDNRGTRAVTNKALFCCALNDSTTCEPLSSACGNNESSCIDCGGDWVSTESMNNVPEKESSKSPSAPTASPPSAAAPSLASSDAPTPIGGSGSYAIEYETSPPAFSYNNYFANTARPTIAFTVHPTTPQPTFSDPGQSCLEATEDGKAIAKALDMPANANEAVLLARSAANQLCTLVQVDSARTRIIPVGRSYQGHRWEAYSSDLIVPVPSFACDSVTCSLTLPTLPDAGYTYELVAYTHDLPWKDEMARFLEQTTFGPTRQELEQFDETQDAALTMATWIKEQQDTVQPSLHREFYRSRLNGRQILPDRSGLPTQPCDAGVRYRKYAFTEADFFAKIEIKTDPVTKHKVLYDESGQIRTVLKTEVLTYTRSNQKKEFADGIYAICEIVSGVGGTWGLSLAGSCPRPEINGEVIGNPEVFFDNPTQPTHPPVTLDGFGFVLSSRESFISTTEIRDPNCDLMPPQRGQNYYAMVGIYDGEYWIFDPRQDMKMNTLLNPLSDGGADAYLQTRLEDNEVESQRDRNREVLCSNVHMSFLNENYCQLSYSSKTCSSRDFPDVPVLLTIESFENMYVATSELEPEQVRYVYAIEGLQQRPGIVPYDPPCTPGEMSRWVPIDDCTSKNGQIKAQPQSNDIFAELFRAAEDDNDYLRDIIFPASGKSCQENDLNRYNLKVSVDGQCWLNVHRMHLQVFDFSSWVNEHPGGKEKIQQFADVTRPDKFRLKFPDNHPMDRFHGWSEEFRADVGRYGDSIRFSDLPPSLLVEEIAVKFGAVSSLQNSGPTVVCGSPGEVQNRLRNGEIRQGSYSFGIKDTRFNEGQRVEIWLALALNAEDQLRQRVAWALNQILVIAPGGALIRAQERTEPWLVFYDIFVRHAFGNYRDILKEVSYSPMMAKMLTMMYNKSTDYLWRLRRRIEFADENYAREVMQLFSIGLIKLNNDGTTKRGENGEIFRTYTNNEITEYARVWTGFRAAPNRGNVEAADYIDPMQIEPEWRDSFPKLGLDQTYVGDGLPLCSDLPAGHFLRKGATYVLLGSNPTPLFHREPVGWSSDVRVVRPQLDSSNSNLFEKLCQRPKPSWRCKYPSKVVLDSDLECFGVECDIQSPRIIEVGEGIYYEYLKPPCAYQGFFSDGQMLKKYTYTKYPLSCGDPRQETGGIGCCKGNSQNFEPTFGRFTGERATFNDAQQVCADVGLVLCENPNNLCGEPCDKSLAYWSTKPCILQAKIGLEGAVAIVHKIPGHTHVLEQVSEETKAFFHVAWEEPVDQIVIDYEGFCEKLGCGRDSFDNLCLCDVEVEEDMVFRNAPSREQVLSLLHIGAFPPDSQSGAFQIVTLDDGVIMHSKDGSYSADSIFEVFDDNGIRRFRKNLRSDAIIGSPGGLRLKFRNPSHMISIHDPSLNEIHHETDAALDHYFYHPNLAPFLSIRIAQRFGISNPSPRYVSTAATAFRVGRYIDEATGIRYGTGEYGNMAALVAAILLDREARSVVLDADPAHGSLLEPFMKLVRMMRSLEFRAKADSVYVDLSGVNEKIGQEPHHLPDVFSFFLPEFQPQGRVGDSGLVCPEAELLTAPSTVNWMNGIFSLVKYGLDNAFGGFGSGRRSGTHNNQPRWEDQRVLGRSNFADGDNRYRPSQGLNSAGVVDELATLLTSGRLSQEKRDLLTTVYNEYTGSEAYINVQQLIATSPEFHTNGLARSSGELRKLPEPTQSAASGYKAIIELYLPGGWDSFNVLFPQECATRNAAGQTVDAQYRSERGEIAMTPAEAEYVIEVDPADGQPCSKFAIHPDTPIFHELWEEGSLIWFANTGVLDSAEINKLNYQKKTVTPLFAHNFMSHQVQNQDPYKTDPSTGLMGRMGEILTAQGYGAQCTSINKAKTIITADSTVETRPPLVVPWYGATRFNRRPEAEENFDLEKFMAQLNPESDLHSSAFGETWSRELNMAISQSNFLTSALENTTLSDGFYDGDPANVNSMYRSAGGMISRFLQTRETRRADRDMVFYANGFWDHHAGVKKELSREIASLNEGIRALVADLKYHGLWDDVAIIIASDFGRTLSTNGGEGADHGWGGHYALMGGSVKGGHILGKYPSDLTKAGELTVGGRGVFIPTTSWEAIWHGLAKWMGVETEEEMREVLPNLHQAYGPGTSQPFEVSDLFHTEPDIFN